MYRDLALWRIQADAIAHALSDNRHKRLSKRLFKLLDQIDEVWRKQFGEDYYKAIAAVLRESVSDSFDATGDQK